MNFFPTQSSPARPEAPTEPCSKTNPADTVSPPPAARSSVSTPAAPKEPGRGKHRLLDRFGGSFLYISIILHIGFALIATWFVVLRIDAKRKLTFQAGSKGTNQAARTIEHKVKATRQKNAMSAPAPSKRITTNAISARVAIPQVEMPMTSSQAPSRLEGGGGAQGFTLGTGVGLGGGPGSGIGTGGIPFFGIREAKGLTGEFYDLKQTKDLKPTDMAITAEEKTTNMPAKGWSGAPESLKYRETLKHLVASSWSPTVLEKFYKAPRKLVTTQIFIPRLLASEAPKAFGVEKTVSPRRWLVHYSGAVIPPKSGRFRFLGIGDDVLMVRMNGKNVLEANWNGARVLPELGKAEPGNEPLLAGPWFELHSGERVKLDVVVGENPGGHFMAVLFIDEEAKNNPPGDYALFLLKDISVSDLVGRNKIAQYSGKKLVFRPADPRSIFDHN